MEEIKVSSEGLTPLTAVVLTDSLDNYSLADTSTIEESIAGPICGCLKYIGRLGNTYNYVGTSSGCYKVVFSNSRGVVTAISGSNFVTAGSRHLVTVKSGENFGFQCC